MKTTLTKFFVLFTSIALLPLLAIAQSWQWGTLTGADGTAHIPSYLMGISSDVHGNTYLLTPINSGKNVYTNNILLPAVPGINYPFLLVSTDGDGKHRWSKQIGGYLAKPIATRVSQQGNVYVLANISSTPADRGVIDTDTTLPVLKQNQKMTLICYDTMGKFKWLVRPDSNTSSSLGDISHKNIYMDIDEDGNVYCLVSFPPGTPLLGSTLSIPTTPPFKGNAFYVLKYSPSGVLLKVTMIEDFCFDREIVSYYATISYNRFNKGYYIYCSTGSLAADTSVYLKEKPFLNKLFLGSFREDGSLIWSISDTTKSTIGNQLIPSPVQSDPMGNVYISGIMIQDNQVNGFNLKAAACSFAHLPFIIKMDNTGKLFWGTSGEPKGCSYAYGYQTSDFAMPASGIGQGTIAGHGRGTVYFGQSKKDTLVMGNDFDLEFDGWYASVDLATGKTLKLSNILSDKSSFSWPKVHYSENQLYIAGASDARVLSFDSSFVLPSKRTIAGGEVFLAKYGLPMGCTKAPTASFTYLSGNFNFTGTSPADSVTWDFGDGTKGKGLALTHKYLTGGKYKACATVWTADCGLLTKCRFIEIPLGIEENSNNSVSLKVYPNPADDVLYIENLQDALTINVYNVLGQKTYTSTVKKNIETISTTRWQTGHYMLQVEYKNGLKKTVVVNKK